MRSMTRCVISAATASMISAQTLTNMTSRRELALEKDEKWSGLCPA